MQQLIKQFNFHDNGVRVIENENGQIFFVAKDVCDVLGYTNSSKAIKDHCKTEGCSKLLLPNESLGQGYEQTIINEGNLYRLVLKSKKKEAERFEAWVCDEVLPSIRQTGNYNTKQQIQPLTQAEIILQLAQENVAQEKRLAAVEQVVQELQSVRQGALAQMAALPVSNEVLPEETTRAKVVRLVNVYCRSKAISQQETWNYIYERMYYLYRVSVKSYKKERQNETWLEVAERNGHVEKMFAIISDLVKKSEPVQA